MLHWILHSWVWVLQILVMLATVKLSRFAHAMVVHWRHLRVFEFHHWWSIIALMMLSKNIHLLMRKNATSLNLFLLSSTILCFNLLYQIGNLLDYRGTTRLLCLLFLLDLLSLASLRTDICIMTVKLAVETHDTFCLRILLLILSQQLIQLLRITGFFLAVCWLVPKLTAVMASDATLALISLCWVSFWITCLIIFTTASINPVAVLWEIGQGCQTERVRFYEVLDVLLVAIWAVWAESKHVILTDVANRVAHRTIVGTDFAETLIIEWAIFGSTITGWSLMSINTLLALETVTLCLIVTAYRHFIFKVAM